MAQGHTRDVTESVPSTGTPPYTWQWLYSVNGSESYLPATAAQCAVPAGSGASAGAVETCAFQTSALTPLGSYVFELRVSDSASTPESATSAPSTPVTVVAAGGSTGSEPSGPPALDTEPVGSCTLGCPTSNWFGSALSLTTAGTNELLVLEVTDSNEVGSGLSLSDISDSQGSSWHLLTVHAWNGSGNNQYFFYAIDAHAGADAVTIDTAAGSLTSAEYATAVLAAFTGVNTTSPVAAVGSFSTGTGVQASASVSTFVAPTTILGVLSTSQAASGISPTTSPAFSLVGSVTDGSATSSFVESYGTLSWGTYTSSPSWTGSVAWGAEAVAIEGSSPLAVSISPSPVVLDLGQSVTLTANATGGTGSLTYTWSVASGTCPGFSNSGASTLLYSPGATTAGCTLTVTVVDASHDTVEPASAASIVVSTALAAPSAPAAGATALDENQVLSVTDTIPTTGTSPYSWQWLVSLNGGGYSTVTHCAVGSGSGASGGTLETCSVPANTLIQGDSYAYEFKVTDSATTAESVTSGASASVTVSSTLTAPGTPADSATKLDFNQALSVTDTLQSTGTPPYAWQWMVSVNSGTYGVASQCTTNSGTGASGGAVETCAAPASGLVSGDTYNFKLQVTDSASSAEVVTSAASATVTVKSTLAAPNAPNPSATSLSAATALTVTATLPTTGTTTYSWQWLVSVNSGTYVAATYCAVNSGSGAASGATETCSVAANTLAASTTYNFEIRVTDSATTPETVTSAASNTVTTTAALAGGTPSPASPVIDSGQSILLTANPSGGTAPYSHYQWYSGASAAGCTGLGTPISGATSATYSASPTASTYYCYTVQDSTAATVTSAATEVTVNSALTAPVAPTVSATVLDFNQALTVTGTIPSTGTSSYQWEWLYSVGSGYLRATMCATSSGTGAAAGAGETCSVAASTLVAGDTYTFELQVNDSAYSPESLASPASSPVSVSSTLTAPAAPTVSATKLDVDQTLTASANIPTTGSTAYSWVWQVSVSGAAYVTATQCALNSGSGATAGSAVTCTVAGNSLVVGDTYAFKLQVTDGATSPESATSGASSTVTVKSMLTAPAAPTPSVTLLDLNQVLTVTDSIPSSGTSNYQYEWLYSTGSGYAKATMCSVPSGSNVGAGAVETCTVAANTLSLTTYTFELKVNDSANVPETQTSPASSSVTVSSALTAAGAPTVSATKLDYNQALTVTDAIPTSGTAPYSWQWLVSVAGAGYVPATQCVTNAGSGATGGSVETCSVVGSSLIPGDSYLFEFQVVDGATNPETQNSAASSSVAVSSTLAAPASPTVTSTSLDQNQPLTVSDTIPTTGSPTFSWQWLVSVGGASFVNTNQCGVNSGSGAASGATENCVITSGTLAIGQTYAFEFEVTDSATSAESQTSPTSLTVTVSSALTPPSVPTTSASALDVNQMLTVTGTIPSSGTAPYPYEWLDSINGGAYSRATVCALPSGTATTGGSQETCTITGGTLAAGSTYKFELAVNDSASTPETQTSGASAGVAVSTALQAASTPAVSATKVDLNQPLTVTATIPSTGTGPYQYEWLFTTTSTYAKATVCATPSGSGATAGALETCAITANSLTPGDTYEFELLVNDSASAPETATSGPSSGVAVSSTLTAPSAPSVGGVAKLDVNQALAVTDTIPVTGTAPYQYEWLYSSGSGYSKGVVCAVPSASGVSGGAGETCSIAVSTLTAGFTYTFELVVNDSASSPESQTSVASSGVVVSTALLAPNAPSVSATALDVNQALTVSGTIPNSGSPTYQYEWLYTTGVTYSKATMCSTPSGNGAGAGAGETCSIVANSLSAGSTYTFELKVNDSATAPESATSSASAGVAVNSALTAPAAPTPSASKVDYNQPFTVSGTIPATGTSPYQYEWLYTTATTYSRATMCSTPGASGASAGAVTCSIAGSSLIPSDTYTFELKVNDSASAPESLTSPASSGVLVSTTLAAPNAPSVSATKLDVNQALTVTGTIPSTGTAPYQWEWLVSLGVGFSRATACGAPSGVGATAGATETCSIPAGTLSAGDSYTFELLVNDSASTAETSTSPTSASVSVSTTLTAPTAPSVGGISKLDLNQALSVTATIPSTGTSTYQYEWLYSVGVGYSKATMCSPASGSGALAGAGETCTIAAGLLTSGDTYTFELLVNDSASAAESQTSPASSSVAVSSTLTAPSAPGVSATKLDVDQSLSVTATVPTTGTSPYTYEWLESTGGPYAKANVCSVPSGSASTGGTTETCSVVGGSLTVGTTYTFELKVNDSATNVETATSSPSAGVVVKSTLQTPGTPTVSATALDADQTLTVTGTIPSSGTSPYSWQWLIAVNGGAESDAGQCGSSASGSGGAAGAFETCTVPGNTLTPGNSYAFEFEVTDGATTGEVETSTASSTVTVNSALTAPSAPSVSATKLDSDQSLTVSGQVPTSGTAPFQYEWLYTTASTYSKATMCATPSGNGATSGSTETCTVLGGSLSAGSTYKFELRVNDSATVDESATSAASSPVAVSSPLGAVATPSLSATSLDVNQILTVTGVIPSTGTGPYSWQWLITVDGTPFADAGQCGSSASGSGATAGTHETCTIPSGTLTAGDLYGFELEVFDSASAPESSTSPTSSTVTVSSALTAPTAPLPSATSLDVNQALTVTDTIPSTGTAGYQYEWLVSTGGPYSKATVCLTPSGTASSGGTPETCGVVANRLTVGLTYTFELRVNDTASSPETATSSPSTGVAVNSALTTPGTPSVSATALDADQPLTVSGSIPSTGTGPYAWQWLVSTGTSYSGAGQCGATESGTGATGGTVEECIVAANTLTAGTTYTFELRVSDSASSPASQTSGASAGVVVSSELTAPLAPTPSATALDADEPLSVTDNLPSSGTSPYSWEWLVSVNGGSYAAATICTLVGGTGGTVGALETCTVPANTLTAGDTYAFELLVNDSASGPESATSAASSSVSASTTLSAGTPTPSNPTIDNGQTILLTANPSGGATPYSYQWYTGASASACTSGTNPISGATDSTYDASPTSTTYYCYQVTDASMTAAMSGTTEVTVNSELTAPTAPTVSASLLDEDQSLTVTGQVPSTGTASYEFEWLYSTGSSYVRAAMCGSPSGTGATAGAVEQCVIPGGGLTAGQSYTFVLVVNDSAYLAETATSPSSSAVSVSSALGAPSTPAVSASALDSDQLLTVTSTLPTSGTAPYAWQWLVSVNGGTYQAAVDCAMASGSGATGGAIETCAIAADTLSAGDSYAFELVVTDGAQVAEQQTSLPSTAVAVAPMLTAPGRPTVSATALDVDQTLVVDASIPTTGTGTYSWQWLVAVNGGAYGVSSFCVLNSGTSATAGAAESCVVSSNQLDPGSTYSFELRVTDSASTPETESSPASALVSVATALTRPGAPAVSAEKLDADQTLVVSDAIPSSGTAPYSWQWLVSEDGGAFDPASVCTTGSGTGASAGATETCEIPGGTLSASISYVFELEVSDQATTSEVATSPASASVAVGSALTAPSAPTVSATAIDANQPLTVVADIPTSGSGPYAWQWLVSVGGGSFSAATICSTGSGTGATAGASETCSVSGGTLSGGNVYAFELQVTDGASSAETVTSTGSASVAVSSALTAPPAPTVSATDLDDNQALTVAGTVPTSGTSPYSWQWLISVGGAPFGDATQCAVDSGSGVTGGAIETCTVSAGTLDSNTSYAFRFEVTDSSLAGVESQTSVSSATVVVRSALGVPTTPQPSATSLALSESLTVSASVPPTGTATYGWQWLLSTNGGAYADATPCGASSSGTGAVAGATEQCRIPAGGLVVGDHYTFELVVTDNATSAESATSGASVTVTVLSPTISQSTAQGPVGASDTVSGDGFSASSGVTLSFNGVLVSPTSCSVGSNSGTVITTSASGAFVCTFRVPSEAAGAYDVVGEDVATSSVTVSATFLVTTPEISLSPTSIGAGTTVTISGTGFSVSSALASLMVGSTQVTSCLSGSLTTNDTGAFSCSFVVPSGVTGTTITVTDVGGQSASASFVPLTPSPTSSSSFPWLWVAVAVGVVVAALLALLVVRRRRAGRPEESEPSVPLWAEAAAGRGTPSPRSVSVEPSSRPERATPAPGPMPEPYRPAASAAVPAKPTGSVPSAEPPVPREPSAHPFVDPLAAALAAAPLSGYVQDDEDREAELSTRAITPDKSLPNTPPSPPKSEMDNVLDELDQLSQKMLKKPAPPGSGTSSEGSSESSEPPA